VSYLYICRKYLSTPSIIKMWTFSICLILINGCKSNIHVEESPEFTGLYAVMGNDSTSTLRLCYSDWDSLDFKPIEGCISNDYELYVYANLHPDIVMAVTKSKIFFIRKKNNEKIAELDFPVFDNPNDYVSNSYIYLFPCYWSKDHCILMHGSIYLIDLKSLTIETTIWDAYHFTPELKYAYYSSISPDGERIYTEAVFKIGGKTYSKTIVNDL